MASKPEPGCTLIDVQTLSKEIRAGVAGLVPGISLAILSLAWVAPAQAQAPVAPAGSQPAETLPAASTPPPSTGGFFPLSEVRKGMMATAWTVFEGDKPEAMQVEILGVLRGARGPGQDMILARLRGAKPEYTGVVAGMSGSPVYIGNRLLGSLSYRIGQFTKEPIAGITPIAQMIEVRELPVEGLGTRAQGLENRDQGSGVRGQETAEGMNFQAMETPLVMSGFRPEAIALWQKEMAGTGLATIAAGGLGGSSEAGSSEMGLDEEPSAKAAATILPGSAVSAQLVRGDLEISATCTVTYVDPKQLLACGHPILQAGPVSLPMTTTDVVATLASPLNAFKIVNTGEMIGAFTEDRDSAIRGVFGMKPRMIPMHIALHSSGATRTLNMEILDLPSLTAQATLVSLYESLLESNQSTAEMSYHLTGSIELAPAGGTKAGGQPASLQSSPIDEWASASDSGSAALELALQAGQNFQKVYANDTRQGSIRAITLDVDEIPRRVSVELEAARLVSGNLVHAGDTVMVEATLHPWRQPARNVRIPVKLPARLGEGSLRILVSDAGTLDRTLDPPRFTGKPANLETVLAQARDKHAADRIYVSLLVPETQAGVSGQTLASLPLSVANAMEPSRAAQDVNLNGESAAVAADAPAGGVLSGFQILNLHIEAGGSLD